MQESILTPLEILDRYHFICALCYGTAVAVHEIVPKSKKPADWQAFENRIPLCFACHDMVHEQGTRRWEQKLKEARGNLASLLRIESN